MWHSVRHFMRHSFWHLRWHSIRHSILHKFGFYLSFFVAFCLTFYAAFFLALELAFYWQNIGRFIWHSAWHPFWHFTWHSLLAPTQPFTTHVSAQNNFSATIATLSTWQADSNHQPASKSPISLDSPSQQHILTPQVPQSTWTFCWCPLRGGEVLCFPEL
jgi:hypothetical protein